VLHKELRALHMLVPVPHTQVVVVVGEVGVGVEGEVGLVLHRQRIDPSQR
jgi:hypothetical protein